MSLSFQTFYLGYLLIVTDSHEDLIFSHSVYHMYSFGFNVGVSHWMKDS